MDVRLKISNIINEYKRANYCAKLYENSELNNPGDYYSENAFDFYKCIYIHIPKAAGISISKALFGNFGAGHRTLRYWENKLPNRTFKKYFKFTIVRNPYSRLFSAYTFLKRGGINELDKQYADNVLKDISSFQEFVEDYLNAKTIKDQIHFFPQIHFLIDNSNEIGLDYIGRFEDLNNSFGKIQKRLKLQKNLPHKNASSKNNNDLNSLFNKAMYDKVNELYEDDFIKLNYSMNE